MPKFSVFRQLAQRMKLSSLTMCRTFFDIVDLIYVHDTCHKCQPTCNLYSGRHRKKGGSRLASFISTVCYCSRKFDSIHQGLKKVSYRSLGQVDFLRREVKHQWPRPGKQNVRASCPKDKLNFNFFSNPDPCPKVMGLQPSYE